MSSTYNLSKNNNSYKRITVFHTLKITANNVYDILEPKVFNAKLVLLSL